jgi:beta-lactamase class A
MHRIRRLFLATLILPGLLLCGPGVVLSDETSDDRPIAVGLLAQIRPSPELQAFLDTTIEGLLATDARLRSQTVRVSLIDLPQDGSPRLAHWNGDSPVYPASVVKFVYLMAAYAWRDQGRLEIDPKLDRQLRAMIYSSSNGATQYVVRRLTDTEAGPRLEPAEYAEFRARRHQVNDWLGSLGIEGLHTVHPTYNGGGDLYGRDLQFLEDPDVPGSLPNQTGEYRNRQAMTANATARLLALLALDQALAPNTSIEVRERMRRDPRKQPYLWKRIAGGGDLRKDLDIFTKTGSWGPIYADAGIVRHASGDQLVVVVFIEGKPAYRGHFIAQVSRQAIQHVLPE